jgi:hypothetical protein
MRRQKILAASAPPELWAIISEAALRQQFGGPSVMKGQFRRLMELVKLPHVTVQVLPFAVGGHAGLNGSFTALSTNDLSVVLVENLTTGWYLEGDDEIRRHDVTFEHLGNAALTPSDSCSLIQRLLSEP